MTASKLEWRAALLARRQQIAAAERQTAAKAACDIFRVTSIFQNSRHIACYYPLQGEFDCLPMIQMIWKNHKNCYLPVISNDHLCFKRYQENTRLQPNRYRIPEPREGDEIELAQLDVVIVPLVGFDAQGHRLGMGAGYYDRTFRNAAGCLVGLAYEIQQAPSLPYDAWDVPLHAVLTEKKFFMIDS